MEFKNIKMNVDILGCEDTTLRPKKFEKDKVYRVGGDLLRVFLTEKIEVLLGHAKDGRPIKKEVFYATEVEEKKEKKEVKLEPKLEVKTAKKVTKKK